MPVNATEDHRFYNIDDYTIGQEGLQEVFWKYQNLLIFLEGVFTNSVSLTFSLKTFLCGAAVLL